MTLFEKIIKREIPSEIIYEDNRIIAFKDINPINPGHFLVVPKKVSINMLDIDEETLSYLIVHAKALGNQEIEKLNVSGYNIQINNGKEAGQEIFHTHIHVIPTKK